MTPHRIRSTITVVTSLLIVAAVVRAAPEPEEVVVESKPPEGVALANVEISDAGRVSGWAVNLTDHELRAVEILIRHVYRWPDEFDPGAKNPSRAHVHVVREPLSPRRAVSFEYEPRPPLPSDLEGEFETRVQVLGYRELVPADSPGSPSR